MMASLFVCHFVASIRSPTKEREAFTRLFLRLTCRNSSIIMWHDGVSMAI